jgi:ribulose-bisphosphate carboxylase small chain
MAVRMGSAAAFSAASASSSKQSSIAKPFVGLKAGSALPLAKKASTFADKTVSNSGRVQCMKVWSPIDNKKFETLSYLPPLSAQQIAREVEYLLRKGWTPCIEFDLKGFVTRDNFQGCGYYDGRYWTMWKLPMFGCRDADQVLKEIAEAKNAYPDAYIRVLGFDARRQVQCSGFLVQRPGQAQFGSGGGYGSSSSYGGSSYGSSSYGGSSSVSSGYGSSGGYGSDGGRGRGRDRDSGYGSDSGRGGYYSDGGTRRYRN